jgi:hypothetical protein
MVLHSDASGATVLHNARLTGGVPEPAKWAASGNAT